MDIPQARLAAGIVTIAVALGVAAFARAEPVILEEIETPAGELYVWGWNCKAGYHSEALGISADIDGVGETQIVWLVYPVCCPDNPQAGPGCEPL